MSWMSDDQPDPSALLEAVQWLEEQLAVERPFGLDEFGHVALPSDDREHTAASQGLRLSPKRERTVGLRRWDQPCWQGEHDSHRLAEAFDNATIDTWWQIAQAASEPRVTSRFADLAWCANPANRQAAELALDAYRACATDDALAVTEAIPVSMDLLGGGEDSANWRVSYVAQRLGRGREIAQALKLHAVEDDLTTQLIALGRASADSDEPANVIWPLRELSYPKKRMPAEAADVGRAAMRALADKPGAAHDKEQIAELIASLLDGDAQKAVWAQVVAGFELMASLAEGGTRYALLHDALEMSNDKGLKPQAAALKEQLGSIDPTEFMQPVRSELEMSDQEHAEMRAAVDEFVDRLLDTASPLQALARFGNCLAANVDEVEAEVRANHEAGHGLATRFSVHGFGSRNYIAETEDERIWAEAVNQVIFRTKFWAFWIGGRFIEQFFEKFGDQIDELPTQVEMPPVWGAVVSQRFAEVLRLVAEDRLDAASHIATPVIEQTFREWAYAAGSLQRNQPLPNRPSEPHGLGAVLPSLKGLMPEPMRRWLKILLVDSPGLNMRNTIGHGTGGFPDPPEMALLLQAMCVPLSIRHDVAEAD